MRRWDVGRVDLAALGKCGSFIGLVSARASSACEVPADLAGGPSFKLGVRTGLGPPVGRLGRVPFLGCS